MRPGPGRTQHGDRPEARMEADSRMSCPGSGSTIRGCGSGGSWLRAGCSCRPVGLVGLVPTGTAHGADFWQGVIDPDREVVDGLVERARATWIGPHPAGSAGTTPPRPRRCCPRRWPANPATTAPGFLRGDALALQGRPAQAIAELQAAVRAGRHRPGRGHLHAAPGGRAVPGRPPARGAVDLRTPPAAGWTRGTGSRQHRRGADGAGPACPRRCWATGGRSSWRRAEPPGSARDDRAGAGAVRAGGSAGPG